MKWSADPALMRDPIHLLAFGFGAGLSPWAPGTFGTLLAIPITLFVMQFGFAAHLGFAIVASGLQQCLVAGDGDIDSLDVKKMEKLFLSLA